jgi:hypothetical protein
VRLGRVAVGGTHLLGFAVAAPAAAPP